MYLTQSIKLNQVCDKLMETLHNNFKYSQNDYFSVS